jgi:autotransporter-associated beta strand protein
LLVVCGLARTKESGKLLLHPEAPTVSPAWGADLLASRDSENGSLTNKGLVAALLVSSCLSSIDAAAQTWIGGDSTYETAGNWNPAMVPGSGATAIFSNTGVAGIDVNSALTVGAFAFSANAAAYTVTNIGGIDFDGAGIQNGSSNVQTIVTGGSAGLTFHGTSSAGSAALVVNNDGTTTFVDGSTAGTATITTNGTGFTFFQDNSSAGNATLIAQNGGTIQFLQSGNAGQARITVDNGGVTFFDSSSASNATIVVRNDGLLAFANSSTAGSANITSSANGAVAFFDTSTAGSATITTNNGGSLSFQDSSSAGNATIVTNNGGCTCFFDQSTGGQARFITNAGGVVDISGLSTTGMTAGSIEGAGSYLLGSKQLTVGGNDRSTEVSGVISGRGGSLVKVGAGTLLLSGNNTYSGGTTVLGGTLQGTTSSLQGNILNNAAVVFNQASAGTYGGVISGTGTLTLQGGGALNLTGNNTYSGGTAVLAGTLAVNGSIAGNVAVGAAGTLGGNGTIAGNVVNAGTLAPGNSIGLLTVNGSFTQMAGSIYQVEANAQGQADRLNVGGAAVIQGGTVQVLAQPGNYGPSTTYTIVRATGGVAGTYAGVTSNFAFLTPSLSYDANDVFLTLSIAQNAFSVAAVTPNQKAVGTALNQSFANASGDFATVIGALAGLNTAQGPGALDAISGQPYADFGTMNTNNAAMFMNALGQQMANARGAISTGQRQALAQACEIESCDAVGPLSAWASALGGLGSVLGDGNASTLTYNFGGAAAGLDYRFDPRFLVGLGAGYTHGTQWVNSFMGQGWSDSVSVAAYGSFTQSNFYLDALAGYAYFNNQLQRQILIPGLQQRTATGSTGANQFLGQVEGGYKVDVYAPAMASITPFGRFQISSVTQNAFSESGAQSLSLNVAQQTTNSQRTTIGADLAGEIALGNEHKIDIDVRLGWQHELANTGRPITAAFAGAPGNSFTVFGATPARDAAVVGLQATTTIAAATQLYLRYDGGVGGGTDNHAVNVGLRMSW